MASWWQSCGCSKLAKKHYTEYISSIVADLNKRLAGDVSLDWLAATSGLLLWSHKTIRADELITKARPPYKQCWGSNPSPFNPNSGTETKIDLVIGKGRPTSTQKVELFFVLERTSVLTWLTREYFISSAQQIAHTVVCWIFTKSCFPGPKDNTRKIRLVHISHKYQQA